MPVYQRRVSDAAYAAGWNGDTTTAPSKNAVYDKIETMGGGVSVADIGSTAETVGGVVDNGVAATAARSDHKHAITNPKLDDLAATDDNTDLDASTTKHGLCPKAVAPAAGMKIYLGIGNGETAYSSDVLFTAGSPANIGTAAEGTGLYAARNDHVHALPDEAVTYAKMQHVSATDKLLGRTTAGAGDVEEIACTAAGRALLDDADAAAQAVTMSVIPNDGWINANETWTYASASTFTVAADVSGKYQKGDKIKWTQTTVKYGHVVSATYSAPNTTVTIVVNTDYTIANAAISANYFSRVENPYGFPDWFSFVHTTLGAAGSAGSFAETAKAGIYSVKGRTCYVRMTTLVTNVGSWSGNVYLTLPIARNSAIGRSELSFNGSIATYNTNPVTQSKGLAVAEGTAYAAFIRLSQAANVTWANMAVNDQIIVNGEYPI